MLPLSQDYEGQKLAEKLYQWIIILFAVSIPPHQVLIPSFYAF